MVKFSPSFLDNLKSRIELSEIVGRSVSLKKKGREYMACCPFHQEKTPSFTVNNEKGFYHCFGCAAHGGVFDFIMKVENASFPEAVEKVADHLGIPVPREELTPEAKAQHSLQEELLLIHEYATQFFEQSLQTSRGEHARAYLEKRGVSTEVQKHFRLGFSLSEKESLHLHLKEKGCSPRAIAASGLIIFPDDGERKPYDKFRGRLMFPIFNSKNKVIAFGGRILGSGEPKYLNSPETEIFKKGFELYNLNFAKDARAKKESWVIVEGYMDVIALVQAGYESVVAPLGTALTEHHIAKAWRFCDTPILSFDGDKAGKAASIRASRRILPFLKPGRSLSFTFLPEGQDPDTFVQAKGLDAFKRVLNNQSIPLIDVIWDSLLSETPFSTPEDKAQVKKNSLEIVAQIEEPTVRTLYRQDLDSRFFNAQRSQSFKKKSAKPVSTVWTPRLDTFLQEKILLALLLENPSLIEKFEESLVLLELEEKNLNNFKKILLEYYYCEKPLEKENLHPHLTDNGWSALMSEILNSSVLMHIPSLEEGNAQSIAKDCDYIIQSLRKRKLVSDDLKEAKEILKETLDAEAWKRFQELKKDHNKSE